MKKFLFFICLLFTGSSFGQLPIEAKLFGPDELKYDLNYLFEKLESIHPSPYYYTSKEKVLEVRAALEKELTNPMTRLEFARKAIPIVAMLKNGHTSLSFPAEEWNKFLENGGNLFPFTVWIQGNRIYVRQNRSSDDTIAPGTEILAINGVPSADILNRLRTYISAEFSFHRDISIQDTFSELNWYATGLQREYDFQLSWNGEIYHRKLSGYPWKEIEARMRKDGYHPHPNYSFYKLDNGLGVIDFRSMVNIKEFRRFLKSTFESIKQSNIKHLAIDIRYNGGGTSDLGDALFDYITSKPYRQEECEVIKTSREVKEMIHRRYWKWWMNLLYPVMVFHPHARAYLLKKNGSITVFDNEPTRMPKNVKNKFSGKVYLLIGNRTFSAANMLAAAFKSYGMGTVIGEETGEPLENFGDIVFFTLPNTRLTGRCSTKKFILPGPDKIRHGIRPDVEIKPSQEDIADGKDVVLEYVKQIVAAQSQS